MWNYEKRLQYPVKITRTNPKMAQVIISQFGGPDRTANSPPPCGISPSATPCRTKK